MMMNLFILTEIKSISRFQLINSLSTPGINSASKKKTDSFHFVLLYSIKEPFSRI